MFKKVTILSLLFSGILMAQQGPIPVVPATLVDSSVYNGIYRGHQHQFFCEPTTGNMVAAWYWYSSSDPDPRRITAATSTDDGQTWIIHENINAGVGAAMNARYASVGGTQTTPIVAYEDHNPGGSNQSYRPVVAKDLLGWGGDLFDNIFIDNMDIPDTILYNRYTNVSVAPDNENLWAFGSYHGAAPGNGGYYYYSEDAGNTWTGPRVVASEAAADSLQPHYIWDMSSRGMGQALGPNNTAMANLAGRYGAGETWRVFYATSSDKGHTWTTPAAVPGTEGLYCHDADNYRNFTSPFLDGAGNWHIFCVAYDTSESNGDFPTPYYAYDLRFDGFIWNITKVGIPQLLVNGLAAWGDYPPDDETRQFNEPAVGQDGTIYYVYSDVTDTTDADGNVEFFKFSMMVMYSEDNGDTWQGPVSVLDNWIPDDPHGAARCATDKLHTVFKDTLHNLYYMGVPTDTIKQIATRINNKISKILPSEYKLYQNYPNPFNPVTTISFDLNENSHVTLTIYNSLGQEVATLVDKKMTVGYKGIVWDASNMPSGTYFYTIKAGEYTETRKMVLLK